MYYIKNQKFLKIARYVIAFTMFVALIEFVRTLIIFDNLNDLEKISIKDNYLRPLLLYLICVPWLILYIKKSESRNIQKPKVTENNETRNVANLTKYIQGFGLIVGLWVIFYPDPYDLAILSAIFLPSLFIALPAISNGKFTLYEEEKKKTSLLLGLLPIGLAGLIRAFNDVHMYTFKSLLYPTLFYFLTLLLLILYGGYKIKYSTLKEFGRSLYGLIALFILCGTTMININCNYGFIKQAQETVSILDKEVSTGSRSGDYYYFLIDKTKNRIHYDKISVSKDLYLSCELGDEIILKYYKGFFDAEFFEVEKKVVGLY